jgi:DNA-binding NarL/FixJ family response regulator
MPRVRWTPEEEKRLLDLIAAGKSWTLIGGTLKRSMKSVKLHAKTLRRTGAKKLGLKVKGKHGKRRPSPWLNFSGLC